MVGTKRRVSNSGEKRKKIKFNRRVDVRVIDDSGTDSCEEVPNEEEEIDLTIEGTEEDDPLNVPELNNEPTKVKNVTNNRSPRLTSLKLRNDLFPERIEITGLPKPPPLRPIQGPILLKALNVSSPRKRMPPLVLKKTDQNKVTPVKCIPNANQQLIDAPNIVERDGCMMFIHEESKTKNELKLKSLCQQGNNANPAVPQTIEKQNIENEELIIIDDDEMDVEAETQLNTKNIVLKKLHSNEVPYVVKKAQLLLAAPMAVLKEDISSGGVTQERSFISPVPTTSKETSVKLSGISLEDKIKFLNTQTVPSDQAPDAKKIAMVILQKGMKIIPPKGNTEITRNKMKDNNLVESNIQPVSTKSSNLSSMSSLKRTSWEDNLEFQKSSLSNSSKASKTSKTGSTASSISVMKQDNILPSTSNQASTNTFIKKDAERRFIGYHWEDFARDSASDDETCEEELGLNNLDELLDFWELIVELYSYNNQMIKSLQNRKRRDLQRIKNIENKLNKELVRKTENEQSNREESTSADADDLKTEKKSKEE